VKTPIFCLSILSWLFHISEAAPTPQSANTATSGGNDGTAAPVAAATESDKSQANQSEKVDTER
jgi:hypothetical protein